MSSDPAAQLYAALQEDLNQIRRTLADLMDSSRAQQGLLRQILAGMDEDEPAGTPLAVVMKALAAEIARQNDLVEANGADARRLPDEIERAVTQGMRKALYPDATS